MSNKQFSHADEDRLEELLAGEVLGDLSEQEAVELRELRLQYPEAEITFRELESTLARVQLGFQRDLDPMPFGLKERIHRSASQALGTASAPVEIAEKSPAAPAGFSAREAFAWVACAAALLLAVMLWRPEVEETSVSLTDQRLAMINGESKVVRASWANGTTPFERQVTGDVIWSNEQQLGFMRFVNMPINDPSLEQYQLWIIDPKRDAEPIDGGVFDINSEGEVIVQIDAKLKVLEPAAFAITIEQPGGVVVSTQDRLPLLAQIE